MNKDTEVARLYNKIATKYSANRDKASNDVLEFPRVVSLAGQLKGKKVLDVGCGIGKHALEFVKKGADVTGIDASSEMIKISESFCRGQGRFLVADFENAKFKPSSFDLINASFSLHYSNRLNHAFKRFHGWLKPNGRMIFSVYHPIQYYLRTKDFDFSKSKKYWIKLHSYDVEVFNFYHPLSEYVEAIVANGFCIRKIEELTVPKRVKGWPREKYTIPSGLLFEIVKK